jgi:hypothetical protein
MSFMPPSRTRCVTLGDASTSRSNRARTGAPKPSLRRRFPLMPWLATATGRFEATANRAASCSGQPPPAAFVAPAPSVTELPIATMPTADSGTSVSTPDGNTRPSRGSAADGRPADAVWSPGMIQPGPATRLCPWQLSRIKYRGQVITLNASSLPCRPL